MNRRRWLGAALSSAAIFHSIGTAEEAVADRWEADVRALEDASRREPPPADAVVFAGSSSIRLWNLGKSFPGLTTSNRGFGGSTIPDNLRYVSRLVLSLKPSRIVFYAGDNDVAQGREPGRIAADFSAFAAAIHKSLPAARIIYISIKPSPARWKLWPKAAEANRLIRDLCSADPAKRLVFADVSGAMLGPDGRPRGELFLDDKLHLNEAGYAVWTRIIAPLLADDGG